MLKADMIANPDKVEAFNKKSSKSTPFWKSVYSGHIYSAIDESMREIIPNLDKMVVHWRKQVEFITNIQRGATLFGFLLLISLKLMTSVIHAAI